MVSRSEIDLLDIRQEFRKNFAKSLYQMIQVKLTILLPGNRKVTEVGWRRLQEAGGQAGQPSVLRAEVAGLQFEKYHMVSFQGRHFL